MLNFDDVTKCRTIEELNEFIRKYLEENHLEGELRKKTYWALFFRWKEETQESEPKEDVFLALEWNCGTTYEAAARGGKTQQKWDLAHYALKAHNARISHPFHGKEYLYCYWMYGAWIYRQKLQKTSPREPTVLT